MRDSEILKFEKRGMHIFEHVIIQLYFLKELSLLLDKIRFFSLEQLGPKTGNTVRSLWAKLRNLSRINLLISYTDLMEL